MRLFCHEPDWRRRVACIIAERVTRAIVVSVIGAIAEAKASYKATAAEAAKMAGTAMAHRNGVASVASAKTVASATTTACAAATPGSHCVRRH
jgi:hypothetical protein